MTTMALALLLLIATLNIIVAIRGGRYRERLVSSILSLAVLTGAVLTRATFFTQNESFGLWIALAMIATVAPLFLVKAASHSK